MRRYLYLLVVCAGFAGSLMARSGALPAGPGPILKRTGFAADGGQTCAACHRIAEEVQPPNVDTRGKLELLMLDGSQTTYKPGVKQRIRVKLTHPEAKRWGFQLTARSENSPTEMAGAFTVTPGVQVRCDDGSQFGSEKAATGAGASCNGLREFAEHTAESTRPETREGVEWDVDWTPPMNEVGRITLSAAGNAANGNGNFRGDSIYTILKTLEPEGACNHTERPALLNLGNAASYSPTLAANAMGSVFGSKFGVAGRTRAAGPGDFVNGAFPKELACIAVDIGGVRAPITYVQTDQINFQVPTLSQTGPLPVVIIANPGRPNELRSDLGSVTLAQFSPAWFTFNNRSIAATSADGKIIADPSVVPGATPAKPGEVVTLYGTGFGLSTDNQQSGQIPTGVVSLRNPFTISVGGTVLGASDILYSGLAPTSISGLYQFNIRIPQSTTAGNVPIVVTMGSEKTQSTGGTIPVAP